MKNLNTQYGFILGILFLLPLSVGASSLYFEPETINVSVGDEFEVDFMVETGKEGVSALQTELSFDPKSVEVVRLNKSGSGFNLWTIEPKFNNKSGSIELGAGISGEDNKGIFKIVTMRFKAISSKSTIKVEDYTFYSGDGFGTLLRPKTKTADFIVNIPPPEPVIETTELPPTPITPEISYVPTPTPVTKEVELDSQPISQESSTVSTKATSTDEKVITVTQEELDKIVEEKLNKELEEVKTQYEPEHKPSFFRRVVNFFFGWLL